MSVAETFEDAFNLLCGRLLGEGIDRKVYECRIDPTLVVKVESSDDGYRSFSNAYEARNWWDNCHCRPIAKWLAPVVKLSPDGRVLLMKRVAPLRVTDRPRLLPAFLTDIKDDNFGLFEGRVVCCDYATMITSASQRLRKANW